VPDGSNVQGGLAGLQDILCYQCPAGAGPSSPRRNTTRTLPDCFHPRLHRGVPVTVSFASDGWPISGLRVLGDCGDLPAEPNVQSPDEFSEGDAVRASKAFLAQPMIRVSILPVVPRAQRDRGEIRSFLPQSPGTQGVGVGRFDNGRTAARSGTNEAGKLPNPSQVIRASVRPPPRLQSRLVNRHSPLRRQTPRQRHIPA